VSYFEPDKRPVLRIPWSRLEIFIEVCSLIGIIINIGVIIMFWPKLPLTVPSHFGLSGKPDSWNGKWFVLISPIISLALYLFITVISRYPHIFNYPWNITEENAGVQYKLARTAIICLKTELVWIFTYIDWTIIQVAMNRARGLGNEFLLLVVLVVFGTLGFYIYRANKMR